MWLLFSGWVQRLSSSSSFWSEQVLNSTVSWRFSNYIRTVQFYNKMAQYKQVSGCHHCIAMILCNQSFIILILYKVIKAASLNLLSNKSLSNNLRGQGQNIIFKVKMTKAPFRKLKSHPAVFFFYCHIEAQHSHYDTYSRWPLLETETYNPTLGSIMFNNFPDLVRLRTRGF